MVKISDEPHHYFHHFLGAFEHLGLVRRRTLKKQGKLNNAVIPCSTNNVHIYSIFDALMPGIGDVATNSAMKNVQYSTCTLACIYALSFYRSQNVLCCRYKFFEPVQIFDCIYNLFKTFCANTKTNFTECKSSFCLAQNICDCHNM